MSGTRCQRSLLETSEKSDKNSNFWKAGLGRFKKSSWHIKRLMDDISEPEESVRESSSRRVVVIALNSFEAVRS